METSLKGKTFRSNIQANGRYFDAYFTWCCDRRAGIGNVFIQQRTSKSRQFSAAEKNIRDAYRFCFVLFLFVLFYLFYLPYLSSIHEKANCIAILWTGSPHSLGSCLFRGLWATCLPHKGGGVPLSALPKDTTSELAGLFSTTCHKCRAPSREAADAIF